MLGADASHVGWVAIFLATQHSLGFFGFRYRSTLLRAGFRHGLRFRIAPSFRHRHCRRLNGESITHPIHHTPVVYLYMNQFQSFCRRLLSCFNPHSTSSVEDSRRRIEVGGLFLPVNEAVTVKDNDTRVSLSLLNIPLKGQQGTR